MPLIMVAADQLQLPDLHEACLQLAQRQLSPKTALPWLLAGHMGKQEALEKMALDYVMDNMAGMRSPHWLAYWYATSGLNAAATAFSHMQGAVHQRVLLGDCLGCTAK
jgi:hypothetical protein